MNSWRSLQRLSPEPNSTSTIYQTQDVRLRASFWRKLPELRHLLQSRHTFQASQLFRNCALASSKLGTRSERAIGGLTVSDQNQRRWSGPPRVS